MEKIQGVSSSSAAKKAFSGKKEVSAAYGQRNQGKVGRRSTVGAVIISNPTSTQQQNNQRMQDMPRRQFTRLSVSLSQVLQHLMNSSLVTLKEPPQNPNITSPRYNPNAWCAYHSNNTGHDTNDCWDLKNKVRDLIEAKEIEFDPPETPNVITA